MAIKRITEKRKEQVLQSYGGDGGDSNYVEQEVEYVTGWQSDVTGQFYEVDPKRAGSSGGGLFGMTGGAYINPSYDAEMQQAIKNQEWEFQLKQEREATEAAQAQQRAQWQAEQQATAAQFAREHEEARVALEEQAKAFEADRLARDAAKAEAERAKQEKLATEQKISGATVLGDMLRVNGVQKDLVATEDAQGLTGQDKQKLLGEQDETTAKQTFLERLLSGKVSGAPKT